MDALASAMYTYGATCALQLLLEDSSVHGGAESSDGLLRSACRGNMSNTISDHCAQLSTLLQMHVSADILQLAHACGVIEWRSNIPSRTFSNTAIERV